MERLQEVLKQKGWIDLSVVLFDDYELLDVFGPMELIAGSSVLPMESKGKIKIKFVSALDSKTAKPSDGVLTYTDDTLDTAPAADVLFVPGGLGTRTLQHEASFIRCLTNAAERSTVILTVCTGSLLLAATGLLEGCKATTNKVAFNEVAGQHPKVQWQRSARWCVDGKFFTSSGVAAGIDLANLFLKQLFGEKVAHMACKFTEYEASESDVDPFSLPQPVPVLKNALGHTMRLVLVAYDQFEMLDTFGPLEMFAVANRLLVRQGEAPAFELCSVAEDHLTRSFGGPLFEMDQTFSSERFEQIDVLLLPGGIGTLREIHNPVFQESIRRLVERSKRVMTVCTGSAILASQGLLDGRRATTNKLAFDLMALYGDQVTWVPEARWVADGKFRTSSGVSAGTDLSLALLRELHGVPLAAAVARHAEYVWDEKDNGAKDPFTHTIPKQTLLHRIFIRIQKAVVHLVFRVGFSLGCKMQITRQLV